MCGISLKGHNREDICPDASGLTYMKAMKKKVGLLINFNVERLKDEIKRLALSQDSYGQEVTEGRVKIVYKFLVLRNLCVLCGSFFDNPHNYTRR